MQTANTIKNQIGAAALMMLGAKDLVGSEDALMFRVGRNSKGVTKLIVQLDPSDTYTVQAWAIRGTKCTLKAQEQGVYVDSLHQVIESLTGMYTRL